MPKSDEVLRAERTAFWSDLAAAAPDLGIEPGPGSEREVPLDAERTVRMKISLSQDKTSVYLVGSGEPAKAWIRGHLPDLADGLRTTAGAATGEAANGRWFRKDNKACVTQRRSWPEAIRWIRAQHRTFHHAVTATAAAAAGARP